MRLLLSLAFILALPLAVLAAETGFPSQTIWVSNSSPAEGEVVVVSAVVYNGGSGALRGTLVFTADDSRIGAREFDIPGDTSQVHSVEWKPREGIYELAARIEGTSAAVSSGETPALSITVSPPPIPSATQKAVTQAVEVASMIASTSAPLVSEASDIAHKAFTYIEAFREAGVETLDNYLKGTLSGRGSVAGSATSTSGSTKEPGSLSTLAHAIAATLLFVMKNVALFYPLLAFLFLGTLYSLAKRVIRKRDDY